MASTGLSKTFSGAGTNNKKGTFSFWFKRSKLGSYQQLGLCTAATSGNAGLQFGTDDRLDMYLAYSGGWQGIFETSMAFKDTNAYYHAVLSWDTTQATASDRLKFYINGQETSYVSISYPPQNQVTTFGNAQAHYINYWNNNGYFDGLMSHFHYCDGYAYAASDFGETDSTTGEWKIKTSPSVNYGTNGFFILKDGNTLTDQSSNTNDWAVATGTLTKTEDNPSNLFACWNKHDPKSAQWNMQYGNTRLEGTGGDDWNTRRATSTLGMSFGKWYAEQKLTTAGSDSYPFGVGYDIFENSYSSSMGGNSNFWGFYQPSGGQIYGGGTGSPLQTSLGGGTGDVIGIALDVDNLTLQFYKNGSTMGTQITGLPSGKTWFFAASAYGNSNTLDCNFGTGAFGDVQLTGTTYQGSGGLGIFSTSVPSGFTALCTKGLNE